MSWIVSKFLENEKIRGFVFTKCSFFIFFNHGKQSNRIWMATTLLYRLFCKEFEPSKPINKCPNFILMIDLGVKPIILIGTLVRPCSSCHLTEKQCLEYPFSSFWSTWYTVLKERITYSMSTVTKLSDKILCSVQGKK